MADINFFREEFERLATDGCIGDPNGKLAYGYLRVSTAEQAEEGRSGLPRQIVHVHAVAAQHGLKIPWGMIYADDHSGFDFRDRPALTQLRQEFKRPERKADTLVIEHLDRLSRNADWHQGFLLDEMQEYHLSVIFWKSFSSRIERAVIGAISQEGMEHTKQRMQEGRILKAQRGRVTAKTRAYGYVFVDSEGKESPKVKRDTYYAPHPEEAEVIRLIFTKVGIEGTSTVSLAKYLQERFLPPGKSAYWHPGLIVMFIRNPLYRGKFIANRSTTIKVPGRKQKPNEPVKYVTKKVQRPESEWITVDVPPLVSTELWETANRILDKNKEMSFRNAKEPYLLSGILICATCGHHYTGSYRYYHWKNSDKKSLYACYRCSSRTNMLRKQMRDIACTQVQIDRDKLEGMVWHCLCRALHEPQMLLDHLDRRLNTEENQGLTRQIAFLERQLKEKDVEDEKLYQAYLADVFDANEFAERRELLKQSKATLQRELAALYERQVNQDDVEAMRTLITSASEKAIAGGLNVDMPFAIKQQMIKLLVDRIVVNTTEKWFRIEGVLSGMFSIVEKHESEDAGSLGNNTDEAEVTHCSIENIPVDGDWDRQSGCWSIRPSFCARKAASK